MPRAETLPHSFGLALLPHLLEQDQGFRNLQGVDEGGGGGGGTEKKRRRRRSRRTCFELGILSHSKLCLRCAQKHCKYHLYKIYIFEYNYIYLYLSSEVVPVLFFSSSVRSLSVAYAHTFALTSVTRRTVL